MLTRQTHEMPLPLRMAASAIAVFCDSLKRVPTTELREWLDARAVELSARNMPSEADDQRELEYLRRVFAAVVELDHRLAALDVEFKMEVSPCPSTGQDRPASAR